jgi:hypothetical protein
MGEVWNNRELQLLKDCYPILNKRQLMMKLPNRSYHAIARKASKLHITKSKNFKRKARTDGPKTNFVF